MRPFQSTQYIFSDIFFEDDEDRSFPEMPEMSPDMFQVMDIDFVRPQRRIKSARAISDANVPKDHILPDRAMFKAQWFDFSPREEDEDQDYYPTGENHVPQKKSPNLLLQKTLQILKLLHEAPHLLDNMKALKKRLNWVTKKGQPDIRRIYDILNILVGVDILKKSGVHYSIFVEDLTPFIERCDFKLRFKIEQRDRKLPKKKKPQHLKLLSYFDKEKERHVLSWNYSVVKQYHAFVEHFKKERIYQDDMELMPSTPGIFKVRMLNKMWK